MPYLKWHAQFRPVRLDRSAYCIASRNQRNASWLGMPLPQLGVGPTAQAAPPVPSRGHSGVSLRYTRTARTARRGPNRILTDWVS